MVFRVRTQALGGVGCLGRIMPGVARRPFVVSCRALPPPVPPSGAGGSSVYDALFQINRFRTH